MDIPTPKLAGESSAAPEPMVDATPVTSSSPTPSEDKPKKKKKVSVLRTILLLLFAIICVLVVGGVLVGLWLLSGGSVDSLTKFFGGKSASSQTAQTSSSTTSVATEPTEYDLYFSRLDDPVTGEDTIDIFPVKRETARNDYHNYLVEQMLLGPTAAEEGQGYFNNLQLLTPDFTGDFSDYTADNQPILEIKNESDAAKAFTLTLKDASIMLNFKYGLYQVGDINASLARAQLTDTLLQIPGVNNLYITFKGDPCWDDLTGLCPQQQALTEELEKVATWTKGQDQKFTFECSDGSKKESTNTLTLTLTDPAKAALAEQAFEDFVDSDNWIECGSEPGAHAANKTYTLESAMYLNYFFSSSVGTGTEMKIRIGF